MFLTGNTDKFASPCSYPRIEKPPRDAQGPSLNQQDVDITYRRLSARHPRCRPKTHLNRMNRTVQQLLFLLQFHAL